MSDAQTIGPSAVLGTSQHAACNSTTDLGLIGDWEEWEDWAKFDWGKETSTHQAIAATEVAEQHDPFAVLVPGFGSSASFDSPQFDFSSPSFDIVCKPSSPTSLPYPSPESESNRPWNGSDAGNPEFFSYTSSKLSSVAEKAPQPTMLLSSKPAELFGTHIIETLSGSLATGSPESKKRKPAAELGEHEYGNARVKRHQQKRTMHSKVEQRYRMNINGKFAALQECIPELRTKGTDHCGNSDDEEADGPEQRPKKGTVLEHARSYILKLESENKRVTEEKNALLTRLDLIKRVTAATMRQRGADHRSGTSLGKLAAAVLTGMMTAESFHTTQETNDTPAGRGLFAPPAWLSMIHRPLVMQQFSIADAWTLLTKLLLLYVAVGYVVRAVASNIRPAKQSKLDHNMSIASPHGASADPKASRRRAFLTATQSIWVPNGGILECAAILLKLVRLSTRGVIDLNRIIYSRLGGTTQEAEAARVKAWDIAVDAQLLGGDVSINRKRLLLTLLGAASLFESPYRCMLISLHAKVLYLSFAPPPCGKQRAAGYVDSIIRARWERARILQKQQRHAKQDELPRHLQHLMELDVDDVLNAAGGHAYDMAWQLGSASLSSPNTIADTVARDPCISSPLDAAAAWWAVTSMQELLVDCLRVEYEKTASEETRQQRESLLNAALDVAPPGSAVSYYGSVVRAVLADQCDWREHVVAALIAINARPSTPFDLGGPVSGDLGLALKSVIATGLSHTAASARALTALKRQLDASVGDVSTGEIGLLSFVALYQFLRVAFRHRSTAPVNRSLLESVAGLLRRRERQKGVKTAVIGLEAERNVGKLCVQVLGWLVGGDDGPVEEATESLHECSKVR